MLATASDIPLHPAPPTLTQARSAIRAPGAAVPLSTVVSVRRDEEIFTQGDAARFCWQVESGCVRTVTLLEDGRRQVTEFLLPGDLLGWEGGDDHAGSAQAVADSTLRRFRLSAIAQHADIDPAFGRHLRGHLAAQVRAAREHMVLLGRKTAAERIASFLLEMQRRLRGPGTDAAVIDLPMSRADMADYLGLTIETVCRGLTELRRGGAIAVARTRISITDRRALGCAGNDAMH